MPPTDAITGIVELADRYGLPIIVLVVVGVLVWRGILRFGPDVDRLTKGLEDRVAYTEARRIEEREGRIAAEHRVEANSAILREAMDAFKDANAIVRALMADRDDR